MRQTGIVRNIDDLGRITIPKELRIAMDMNVGEPMEILTDRRNIVLRSYRPEEKCIVTGEVRSDNLKLADGNIVLSPAAAVQLAHELLENIDF